MPKSGSSKIGINAVAAIGMASVTHQIAIQIPIAATFQASGVIPSGVSDISIAVATRIPSGNPIF
jgi:hypothetical protein